MALGLTTHGDRVVLMLIKDSEKTLIEQINSELLNLVIEAIFRTPTTNVSLNAIRCYTPTIY